jgi:hypothetical protein
MSHVFAPEPGYTLRVLPMVGRVLGLTDEEEHPLVRYLGSAASYVSNLYVRPWTMQDAVPTITVTLRAVFPSNHSLATHIISFLASCTRRALPFPSPLVRLGCPSRLFRHP